MMSVSKSSWFLLTKCPYLRSYIIIEINHTVSFITLFADFIIKDTILITK